MICTIKRGAKYCTVHSHWLFSPYHTAVRLVTLFFAIDPQSRASTKTKLLCSATCAHELIWLLGTGGGVDVHGITGTWYIMHIV